MFKRKIATAKATLTKAASVFSTRQVTGGFGIEGLEGRRLLSHGGFGGHGHGGGGGGHAATIEFGQLPTAVQTGLDNLATTDGVTAPTSTSTIHLGNSNGVETYTYDVSGTGTTSQLTVDTSGNAVTAVTHTSTTFGAVTDAAATSELTAIASALSLTAPASTDAVTVTNQSDGTAIYTIRLTSSTSTSSHARGTTISVDENGNPVGNERVPLSTLSTAVQNGLTSNAPAGATALTSSSLVNVKTLNGVTTYSVTYTTTGTRTTITVGEDGALANLPSTSTTTYSTIASTAAGTELQALATADGLGTIGSDQTVYVYDEANGTTLYTVRLPSTDSTSGRTVTITLTADQAGNPTTLPDGGDGFGFGGGFGGRGDHGGGGCGGDFGGGDGSTATGTGTTTGTTTTTSSLRRSSRHRG